MTTVSGVSHWSCRVRISLGALAFSACLVLSVPSQADPSLTEPPSAPDQGLSLTVPEQQSAAQESAAEPIAPLLGGETAAAPAELAEEQTASLPSEPVEAAPPGEDVVADLLTEMTPSASEPSDTPTTGAIAAPIELETSDAQDLAGAEPSSEGERQDVLALTAEPPAFDADAPDLGDQGAPILEISEEPSIPLP